MINILLMVQETTHAACIHSTHTEKEPIKAPFAAFQQLDPAGVKHLSSAKTTIPHTDKHTTSSRQVFIWCQIQQHHASLSVH